MWPLLRLATSSPHVNPLTHANSVGQGEMVGAQETGPRPGLATVSGASLPSSIHMGHVRTLVSSERLPFYNSKSTS